MKPIPSLSAHQSFRLPEEPTVFSLLLSNPTTDTLSVGLPASGFWRAARLRLTRPDGTVASFRLAEAPPPSPAEPLELFEEAEIEHSFSLEGHVPGVGAPGAYCLEGVLESWEGEWPIPPARWIVEAPRPALVAIARPVDLAGIEPVPAWSITRGSRRSSLVVRELLADDGSTGEGLQVSAPRFLCPVDGAASSLVAADRWVAWLEPGGLKAGFQSTSFHTTSLSMPGKARILGPLLPRADGGADAFVLHEETGQISWVRLSPPVPIEPPPADLDDDFPDPSAYIRFPSPEVLGSFPAPVGALHAAGSRAVERGSLVALAALSQVGSNIEVRFTLPGEGRPVHSTSARIADARIIPGAEPAIAFDEQGRARVAVLFEGVAGAGGIGVAVLAFDQEGYPILMEGVGQQRFPSPAHPPIGGAIALFADALTGSLHAGWCALLEDGSCLVHDGLRRTAHLRPPGKVVTPVALLASPACCAVACQSEDGAVFFASV